MTLPLTPAAYEDCYKLFALAITYPTGVRTPFPSESAARHFQNRMHTARKLQRDQSRRVYPPDNPLYDTSEFDSLQVQLRFADDEWWIYVRPHGVKLSHVEIIDEEETIPDAT